MTYSNRQAAAVAGQSALFDGGGATVQLPMFTLAPRQDEPTCEHAGDRQPQLTLDGLTEIRCCTCGEIVACPWSAPTAPDPDSVGTKPRGLEIPPPAEFEADIRASVGGAYTWSSMTPERRFAQSRSEYAATLATAFEKFRSQAEAGGLPEGADGLRS